MGYLIIARWGAMDVASRFPPNQVNSGFLIIFELSKRPRVSYRKLKLNEPNHSWVTLEPLWGILVHFGATLGANSTSKSMKWQDVFEGSIC